MKNNTKNNFEQETKQFLDNKDQRTLQGLLTLLQKLGVYENNDEIEYRKFDLIQNFICDLKDKGEGINIDNLLEILNKSKITDYKTIVIIVSYFVESPFNEINSVADFCELLKKIAILGGNNVSFTETLNIVRKFLSTEHNIKMNINDIHIILNSFGKDHRNEMAGLIFNNNQKLISADFFSLNNLQNLLDSNQENVNDFSDYEKVKLITSFLENKNTKITITEFLQIIDITNKFFTTIKDTKESIIKSNFEIISAFFLNKNNVINIRDVEEILERSMTNEKVFIKPRLYLIKTFLSQSNSTFTIDDLLNTLLEIERSFRKEECIRLKLEILGDFSTHHINKINTHDNFVSILDFFFKNFESELLLAAKISKKYLEHNTSADIESLSYVVLNELFNEEQKLSFITSFISNTFIKTKPPLNYFIELISKLKLTEDVELVAEVCECYCTHNKKESISEKISVIFEMADLVYPRDIVSKATLLFMLFDENTEIKNDDHNQSVELIKNFLNKPEDVEIDFFYDFIRNLSMKDYFTKGDILNLIKNKSESLYPSVYELLNNIKNEQKNNSETKHQFSFEKYLTPSGSKYVIKMLTEKFLLEQINNKNEITIADIFSYFYVQGQLARLIEFINPEILDKLRKNFTPSKNLLLVSPSEKEILDQLLVEDPVMMNINTRPETESIVEKKFFSNKLFCDYFTEKLNKSTLNFIYENQPLNFSGTDYADVAENQDELNNLFKDIMEIAKQTGKQKGLEEELENIDTVAEFFQKALSIDIGSIDEGKEKIFEFFQKNHNNLAYALTSKNIGLKEFKERLIGASLRDGCSKNIGSVFMTILYGSILETEFDKTFYSVLGEKIIPTILNSGGDLIGDNNNPLTNKIILDYYISPNALIREIAESRGYDSFIKESIIKAVDCDEKSAIKALELLSNNINDINGYDVNNDNNGGLDSDYDSNREMENSNHLINFLLLESATSDDSNDIVTDILKKFGTYIPYDQIVNLWDKMKEVAIKEKSKKTPVAKPSKPKIKSLKKPSKKHHKH